MDAGVHQVQGETALVVNDLLQLLQEFYADKLASVTRHVAGARLVPDYDANNAYQYVINSEDTQLSWVAQAIVSLGGAVASDAREPERKAAGTGPAALQAVYREDAREAQAFVDRWRDRVEAMTHARHRGMLRVVLGETLEQKRFFEQALAGRTDLLGRRTADAGARVGSVLPTRWIE
jgi:hypothetical protein